MCICWLLFFAFCCTLLILCKAARVLEAGARWCDSVAECVHGAECVITMVGFPKDVEEVYLAPNGIIGNASPGALLIDMTTTKPALAVVLNLHCLDQFCL